MRNKHDQFIAFVARQIDDTSDAFVHVEGKQGPFVDLEQAQACFADDQETDFAKVFLNPVPSGGVMGTWLSQLQAANPAA